MWKYLGRDLRLWYSRTDDTAGDCLKVIFGHGITSNLLWLLAVPPTLQVELPKDNRLEYASPYGRRYLPYLSWYIVEIVLPSRIGHDSNHRAVQ